LLFLLADAFADVLPAALGLGTAGADAALFDLTEAFLTSAFFTAFLSDCVSGLLRIKLAEDTVF
jgi:hypothetical protein